MKKEAKFEDLFQEQLEDLYDAEKQIVAALPKIIAASSSEQLSGALESHLQETEEQVIRLQTIFEQLALAPGGRESKAMQGLLSEGEKLVGELERSQVLDIALIGAARKVEHYEMAAYASVCGLAEMLGRQEAFELLQDTMEEETEAEATLADLAESVLTGDTPVEEEEEDEEIEEEEEEEVERGGGAA